MLEAEGWLADAFVYNARASFAFCLRALRGHLTGRDKGAVQTRQHEHSEGCITRRRRSAARSGQCRAPTHVLSALEARHSAHSENQLKP